MMPIKQMNIAVIGDAELNAGMRLAGVSLCYVVKETDDAREETRKALNELLAMSDIGVIALQEDFTAYVTDIVERLASSKRLIPVVIEVPSKFGTQQEDIIAHYRSYIRKFVGFDIQI